ncbi:MAG TPA: hypothetical protein VIH27_06515 [Nitrososphaerales archaeon]
MPTKTNDELKRRILSLYSHGLSYREISEEVGVSTSTVHGVVAEGCKKHLDLESMRNLFKEFRKSGHDPIHVEHVIAAEERWDKLNIKPDQIPKALDFLEKTGYGENTMAAIQCAIKLQQLEKKSSLTGQQFLDWYYTNEPKREAIETQMKNTQAKYEKLEAELPNMNELINMKNTLRAKSVTLEKLPIFLDTSLTLEKLGFTKEAAKILAEELFKTGMTPENAARRIANQLTRSTSLESAIGAKEETLRQLSQAELHLNQNVATLSKESEKITKELASFEDTKRKEYSDFNKEFNLFENEKLKGINDKVAQKDQEIKEKTTKLEEITKKHDELISKTEAFKDRIILGEALEQILRDSTSTTIDQLRRLGNKCQETIKIREGGLLTGSLTSDAAKGIIVDLLTKTVRTDMLSKNSYNTVLIRCGLLEEKLKNEVAKSAFNLLAIPQRFQENREYKEKVESEQRKMENALGLEAFHRMMPNYENAPISVLENIKDVMEQCIRAKSGLSSYSTKNLKPETWRWFSDNYNNRSQSKPVATTIRGHLVSKHQDDKKSNGDENQNAA